MPTLTAALLILCAGVLLGCTVTHLGHRTLRRWKARRVHPVDPGDALQIAARYAKDGIVIQDMEGRVEWINPGFTDMTGRHLDELQGRTLESIILPVQQAAQPGRHRPTPPDPHCIGTGKLKIRRCRRSDGSEFWVQTRTSLTDASETMQKKAVVVCRDVSEQVTREHALLRAERELKEQTERDFLTGTANRSKLNTFLGASLKQAATDGNRVGLIALDLDRFKIINDEIGHAAGDAVLVHAAAIMHDAVSMDDVVCRTGGDEFILVCPAVRGFDDLVQVGRTILENVSRSFTWEGQEIDFGVSIGIALSDEGYNDIDVLLRKVDMALYSAKENGRGRIVCFDEAFRKQFNSLQRQKLDFVKSVRSQSFEMMFQPLVDAQTMRPVGFETLIRWRHPTRGLVEPGNFLGLADELDLTEKMDRIAIGLALDGAVRLRDHWPEKFGIGINISPAMLSRADFVDILKWEIDLRNLSPSQVVIEVLETTIIGQENEGAMRTIAALKDAGIAVALDDFGTGYAGLAHLAHLSFRYVKIDKSLVFDITTNEKSRVITEAIVGLCHQLDRKMVAEGVETEEQADLLRHLKADLLQGFGIARPMPLDRAVEWLEAQKATRAAPPAEDSLGRSA
ncbi:putative bifunctional diguanylate cyclase/phosphodiesterase [Algicella marina]|nr:GGDEF domain-containing phosphodiesterase [Algicella marina]